MGNKTDETSQFADDTAIMLTYMSRIDYIFDTILPR